MTKNKLRAWGPDIPWDEGKLEWEETSASLSKTHPLKTLSILPKTPPIAEKRLTYKSIKYLLLNDPRHIFTHYFFKHPFTYATRFIRSILAERSYTREGDFFLYGFDHVADFQKTLKEPGTLFVVGFSYCHKPFECPSGRFSPQCQHSLESPICRQCFIGKMLHALPKNKKNIHPLFITTIHHVGEELFKLKELYPNQTLLFLITACEMALEMFCHWGNMIQAKGIGVCLKGRVCSTMQAFVFSEKGIKPGLTLVPTETQERMLSLIKLLWD